MIFWKELAPLRTWFCRRGLPTGKVLTLLVGVALPGCSPEKPSLELYIPPSRMYALHKPPGWKVEEETRKDLFSIAVSAPDASSKAVLLWSRLAPAQGSKRITALDILRTLCEGEKKGHADAAFSETVASPDGTRAAVTERFHRAGSAFQSRVFAETDGKKVSLQYYTAPEATLKTQRPLLMNVLMSVAFIKAPPSGNQPPPLRKVLVQRQAQDGSVRVRIPEDWGFLAGKGMVVAGEPGGGAGFIFTAFGGNPMLPGATVLQGVIGRPYLSPAQTLPVVLLGFGHRDPQVTSARPDAATAAQYRAMVGRNCEASDLVATWTSKEGAKCLGAFKVVNGVPAVMGQWTSILAGIWGPRGDFARYLPVLEQVAASYSVNDQYARQYIQAGLANLRRLQQQTAQAMQSLSYAREDMQRGWEERQARKDYMESKWDDYRRGNSYWVSDLEGGKVYHTDPYGTRDTRTGDYYEGGQFTWTNFEGQNPQHASEGMREISSYELEHGAPPP
jgi:hypothetical protein